MSRFALRKLLWIALIPALGAQTPDARELLKQSAQAIKQYKSYQLESVIDVEMRGGTINNKMDIPSAIWVRRPDKVRITSTSSAGTINIVGDGEHTWFYLSTVKKYVKRNAVEWHEASAINSGMLPKDLPDLNQSIKSIKLTGEETLSIDGVKTPCWVIETLYDKIVLPEQEMVIQDAKQVTWISKDRTLNLQSTLSAKINFPGSPEPVQMTQSTRTTKVLLDIKLPDSLFVFTPPAGSTETADWTLPGVAGPELIGKPAPAGLIGPAEKGKVILVYFWTTWCKPCKPDLPALQALSTEFHDQGLDVIGVTVGEEAPPVEGLFPMVGMDDASGIVTDVSLTAFPTFVLIDRDGNIAGYEVGIQGQAALRESLKKVGIAASHAP
jgi:outer membrane lipoprotein-sorting protein